MFLLLFNIFKGMDSVYKLSYEKDVAIYIITTIAEYCSSIPFSFALKKKDNADNIFIFLK